MKKTLVVCAVALLATAGGCNNNQSGDEVLYRGKPIKMWIKELKTGTDDTRRTAQANLRLVGPDDTDIVPGLVDCLSDEDPFVRKTAADLLGNIGPGAKAALPALSQLNYEKNKAVWKAGYNARRRIEKRDTEPEK